MEKKNFITLLLGVVGGLLFSLGMCMCLIPEWEAFNMGVILGAIGAVQLLITWVVYRKMSGKKPIKLNFKIIGKVIYGIFAGLIFGLGMCMVMVFGQMVAGIVIGLLGIVLLLCLIPMCLGFKPNQEAELQNAA